MFPDSLREAVFGAFLGAAKKFVSLLLNIMLSVIGCLILFKWLRVVIAALLISGVAVFLARVF